MNEKIRQFAKESHLDVYGLGKDRAKWEATLEQYTKLVILECDRYARNTWEHGHLLGGDLKVLFNFEELNDT
jgi:hypothetical protein